LCPWSVGCRRLIDQAWRRATVSRARNARVEETRGRSRSRNAEASNEFRIDRMVGRLLIRPTMSIFSFGATCGNSAPLIWRITLNRKWLAHHLIVQRCVQRKIEFGQLKCVANKHPQISCISSALTLHHKIRPAVTGAAARRFRPPAFKARSRWVEYCFVLRHQFAWPGRCRQMRA